MSKETDELLYHPEVLAVISAILRMTGVRGHLLEDEVQEAVTRTWAATAGDRPDTLVRWKKICRPVTQRYGISELRKRKARAKRNVGPTGDPDAHASNENVRPRWDERDARRALDLLWMLLDDGVMPRDFETFLDRIQAGDKIADIARETGMTDAALRKQLFRGRMLFAKKLAAAGLGSLAVIWVITLIYPYVAANTVAHDHTPSTLPDAAPPGAKKTLPPVVMVDTHEAEIAALRAEAEAAAKKKSWQVCAQRFSAIDQLRAETARAMDAEVPVAAPDALKTTCEENYMRSLDSKGGPGK